MRIRDATADDQPSILAITNHFIASGTAVWTDRPLTPEQRSAWLAERQQRGLPILVADDDGDVVGFASYGPFRPWDGYRHTVELSVYVAPGCERRGIGRRLVTSLLERAADSGVHVIVAGIEAGNTASLGLHSSLGFVEVGRMPEVGRKFDRWLDLVLMQRILDD
jgi:phosphinothricin acetyltransferase